MKANNLKDLLSRNYVGFIFILIIIFACFLTWFHLSRINDFQKYHYSLSSESTAGSAQQTAHFIAEQNRFLFTTADEPLTQTENANLLFKLI